MSDTLSAFVSIGFHGLAFAMVLYLISVGLSVTMGLMGFVNLAHGAFAMAGGYALTTLMGRLNLPFALALVAAVAVVVLASFVLERLLYRRLYGGDELDQVLMTMGLIFITVGAATYFWGPVSVTLTRAYPPSARVERVTKPPSGEYLIALFTRLLTTWISRSRSPATMGSLGSRSALNSTVAAAVPALAIASLSTSLMSTSPLRMLIRPDSMRSRSSMSPISRLILSASLNM